MIDTEDRAREFVAELSDSAAMDKLAVLAALLTEESSRQNLIATATLPAMWQRHIADSAQLLEHVPRETPDGPWLDLGTGAGFPGLVIAAMRPDWNVCLVESRRKRAEWLERARAELKLPNCRVVASRLELVESFEASVISARAFAPLPRLLDLSTRFSTNRTVWLLPKGRSAAQELNLLPESAKKLFHVEQSRTDPDAGILVGRVEISAKTQKARRKA